MIAEKRRCPICNKKVEGRRNKKYCSKKCTRVASSRTRYKKELTLCRLCKKNYHVDGAKRCRECYHKKKYYRLSSIASIKRYRDKKLT